MNKNEIIDFFKDLLVIVIIVVIVRTFLIMPFQINGQSMYSSYYNKEFIIIDRLSYYFTEPKRGDVVVFKPYVSSERVYFLKRILAIPGDTLKIEDGHVYLKKTGELEFTKLNETYLNDENKGFTFIRSSSKKHEYKLSVNDYFLIGDNRNHSTDSRECFSSCSLSGYSNFVTKEDLTGKLLLDLGYFNFKTLNFIHPDLGISTQPKFFDTMKTFNYE